MMNTHVDIAKTNVKTRYLMRHPMKWCRASSLCAGDMHPESARFLEATRLPVK